MQFYEGTCFHMRGVLSIFYVWKASGVVEQLGELRKILIITNSFSTNRQFVKIKLMQNETNHLSIFLVKTKYW